MTNSLSTGNHGLAYQHDTPLYTMYPNNPGAKALSATVNTAATDPMQTGFLQIIVNTILLIVGFIIMSAAFRDKAVNIAITASKLAKG